MSTYAIGDIHGCFDELILLLDRVGFSPGRDTLLLTGDLINRGPKSLETLRWARRHEGCLRLVLGNHDLHLIATALGVGKGDSRDTIDDILKASDCPTLIDWLREMPLLLRVGDFYLVHAGLHPDWSFEVARLRAREAESILQGRFAADLLRRDVPSGLSLGEGIDRARESIACLTRLRACDAAGAMNARFIGPPRDLLPPFRPWFDWPSPRETDKTIVFGHWAALDVMIRERLIALDSGCVWNRCLSALRLEDRALFQQPSKTAATPVPPELLEKP